MNMNTQAHISLEHLQSDGAALLCRDNAVPGRARGGDAAI